MPALSRLVGTGWLVLLSLSACSSPEPEIESRSASPAATGAPTNLLLITMDTTRADRLGSYGYASAETPNLDALAARGARFDQAMAPVALTRPSHATLLTGKLPQTHGVWSNGPYRLDPVHRSLPALLRQRGFSTAAVVASFVLGRSFGLEQGIDLYDDSTREIAGGDPEKTAAEVVGIARGWLGGSVRPPFFLWAHFYDPHHPYTPPSPFGERFAQSPYDGEIAAMDAAIGDLLQELEARGWLDDTLVVAVSDHGEGLGEKGETTHGYFLYDNTLRVPLILAGPGVPQGIAVREQVTLADLAPSLLEAFEIEAGEIVFDGRSFWSELRAGAVTERPALLENRAIQHQYGWFPISALRSGGWKWVYAPARELYDLTSDPDETTNIFASHPQEARHLQRAWKELRREGPDAPTGGLSPEEERKLAALGYLSAPASSSSSPTGVDPKAVSGAIEAIETLITARRSGLDDRTERILRSVLDQDPGNLFALRVQGQLLVAEKRFQEAVGVLERIVAGHETHPETLATLATAYENLGQLEKAIGLYTEATTPPWIYWPALESLARIARGRPAAYSRETLVTRLSSLAPQSGRERLSMARAWAIASEFPRAERWFAEALAASPDLVEARVGLAQMQSAQGRRSEALETLAAVEPATVESTFVAGTIHWAQGDRATACRLFREAEAQKPNNANLVAALAAYFQQCG